MVIWNEIQAQVVTLFEACQFFAFYLRSCLLESMTHALKPCSRQHRIPENIISPPEFSRFIRDLKIIHQIPEKKKVIAKLAMKMFAKILFYNNFLEHFSWDERTLLCHLKRLYYLKIVFTKLNERKPFVFISHLPSALFQFFSNDDVSQ